MHQRSFSMFKLSKKKQSVEFKYNNDKASSVVLVGDFNAWDPGKDKLKKGKDGYYRKILKLPAGTYEYKFLVDGRWENDPLNNRTHPNLHNTVNNVIEVN